MTLVVSEISKQGIIMIGDSAVTCETNGILTALTGASKVHYSERANIGFAVWGKAVINARQVDAWMHGFTDSIRESEDIEAVGQRLAGALREEVAQENKGWDEPSCGIHVSGYMNGLPRLWQIHCGLADETPHEPRLYHDYPEDRDISEDIWRVMVASTGCNISAHLRNGCTPYHSMLFDKMLGYVHDIRNSLNIRLPRNTIEGRLELHKALIRFVAGALTAAGEHPYVDDRLSSVTFTENGLLIDERLPLSDWSHTVSIPATSKFSFGSLARQ
jgi:hypothetical protein